MRKARRLAVIRKEGHRGASLLRRRDLEQRRVSVSVMNPVADRNTFCSKNLDNLRIDAGIIFSVRQRAIRPYGEVPALSIAVKPWR
jgi:hypothetical protein